MNTINPIFKLTLSLCAVAITLTACSGGGGGDSSSGADSSLIIGGPSGQPASDATVEQIQATAAARASEGLGANLDNLQTLSNDALQNLSGDGMSGALLGDTDTAAIGTLDTSTSNFLQNSLGVDDPMATVTRSGDVITIDPDEQSLCADEFPLVDSLNDDITECMQLASDLLVEIDAATDESGVITYLFQNEPVMLIGYSPMGASYELRIGAIQRVSQRAAQISGAAVDQGVNLAGAVRFSGLITNDQAGSEAGELALEVTETLSLTPTNGSATLFSLEPSTVFRIGVDEATGDVVTNVNWGALQLIAESGEADSDGNSSSSVSEFFLGGLSANATINTDNPALQISNLGIGGVPLTVTINQVESLRLDFDTLGISLDDETGMLTLDGALGAALTINNVMGMVDDLGEEATTTLAIEAPAGTVLSPQQNGSTRVDGGSLVVSAVGVSNSESIQQNITINDGECFDGSGNDSQASTGEAGVIEEDDSSSLGVDTVVVACD